MFAWFFCFHYENEDEALETHIPRHRDPKTKKPRHRDSKTKKPRHRDSGTKAPRHRETETIKPRHRDSKTKKPRHRVSVEFWLLCPLILNSRYLPGFSKPGARQKKKKKNHKSQYGLIRLVLSQNFHQSSPS